MKVIIITVIKNKKNKKSVDNSIRIKLQHLDKRNVDPTTQTKWTFCAIGTPYLVVSMRHKVFGSRSVGARRTDSSADVGLIL